MGRSTQLAFPFSTLFGENVAFKGLAALETAVARPPEALGGTSVGFNFWHLFAPKKLK